MELHDFKWLNRSATITEPDRIAIYAAAKTDRFNAPVGEPVCSAPFMFTEVSGDFVLRAKVSMDGHDDYDGAGLFAMSDDDHWIKVCLENTDFGTIAVISVVTNGASDDANGPNVGPARVWLQIARKGSIFAAHYSLDGLRYDMIRICALPCAEPLKAGFVAQSPVGAGGWRWFEHASIERRTVEDIRRGM